MKIAIVGTKSVPYTFGGMDRFYEGLHATLSIKHETDLILHPVDERTFEGIMQGYIDFYEMDLTKYDVVISTKGPSYMVQHPYHINFLPHRIRVFYDLYEYRDPYYDKQRKLIQALDSWALSKEKIKKQFAIGETVRQRLLKYGNIESELIYLPPTIKQGKSGEQRYWLVVSRLHPLKRIDLAVKAMTYYQGKYPLKIVGQGPHEDELKKLAGNNNQIEFIGSVSDEELVSLYEDSIGVIFTPLNEDLGLITLEAFMYEKPVVTTFDSGEPAVIIGKSGGGSIVNAEPENIAQGMQEMESDLEYAHLIGQRGKDFVQDLTWEKVCDDLLEGVEEEVIRIKKPPTRMLVSDNQILDPPVGGGRQRIYNLYRSFPSNEFDIKYVGAYDWPGPEFRRQYLAKHFEEIVTPLTQKHFKWNALYSKLTGNVTTIDVTMPKLMKHTSRFIKLLEENLEYAQVVSLCHPWVYPKVRELMNSLNTKPVLVYDSQNFEYGLKTQLIKRGLLKGHILNMVYEAERDLVNASDLIFACSSADVDNFVNEYKINRNKVFVVPNGVMVREFIRPEQEKIDSFKRTYGLNRGNSAVFIGSNYPPNIDAVEFIVQNLANQLPECDFVVVGGAGEEYKKAITEPVPDNVHILGMVDEEVRNLSYYASDVAINPMSRGSGTNIKMFDFMASRLPIISTPVGARGIEQVEEAVCICELEKFGEELGRLFTSVIERNILADKAYRLVKENYDWEKIAQFASDLIKEKLDERRL